MESLAFLLIPLLVFFGVSWFAERLIERYDEDLPQGAMPKSGRPAELILARHWINHVRVDAGPDDFYSPSDSLFDFGFVGRRLRRDDDDDTGGGGGGGGSSGDDTDDVAGGLFD